MSHIKKLYRFLERAERSSASDGLVWAGDVLNLLDDALEEVRTEGKKVGFKKAKDEFDDEQIEREMASKTYD